MVRLVRIGHIEKPSFPEQMNKCNFLAFMCPRHSVRYIPIRDSMYPHTTTPPLITRGWAEMYWAENGAKRGASPTHLYVRDWDFVFSLCECVFVCVYLGSLSCPCWVPWPRLSSYIREAWKQAWGHLERPISSQTVGHGEVSWEIGDWETVWETAGEGEGKADSLGTVMTSEAKVTWPHFRFTVKLAVGNFYYVLEC